MHCSLKLLGESKHSDNSAVSALVCVPSVVIMSVCLSVGPLLLLLLLLGFILSDKLRRNTVTKYHLCNYNSLFTVLYSSVLVSVEQFSKIC